MFGWFKMKVEDPYPRDSKRLDTLESVISTLNFRVKELDRQMLVTEKDLSTLDRTNKKLEQRVLELEARLKRAGEVLVPIPYDGKAIP